MSPYIIIISFFLSKDAHHLQKQPGNEADHKSRTFLRSHTSLKKDNQTGQRFSTNKRRLLLLFGRADKMKETALSSYCISLMIDCTARPHLSDREDIILVPEEYQLLLYTRLTNWVKRRRAKYFYPASHKNREATAGKYISFSRLLLWSFFLSIRPAFAPHIFLP